MSAERGGWFRRVFSGEPDSGRARERKSVVLGTSEALGNFLIFGEGSAATPTSALSLYEQSTAVSIPVNAIAEAFSVINPTLLIDQRVIPQHPILDLLRKPSAWHGQELFLDVLAKNYLVTGEFALVALGAAGSEPQELVPISPKSLTATQQALATQGGALVGDAPSEWFVSGNSLSGRYRAETENREVRFRDGPLRELYVGRNFSTRDNSLLRGQSPLLSASREARSQILGSEHNVQLLTRGGRVSLAFHFEEDLSDDDFEAAKQRVRAQYGGASKAGEIGVTAGPKMSIKELGGSPKDMDYPGLQKIVKEAVASVYRFPMPLISSERQTMNNYREAKLALYDDAVIPLSRRIYGGLGDFLFERFGLDPRRASLAINPDDVTALIQRRNDELLKRRQIGAETDNELRALMAREPIEGGNVLYKPAALIPAGSDLFTADEDPAILESEDDR